MLGKEGPRVIGRLCHIDQLAKKAEQRHLDHRRKEANHQHGNHQRPDLLQVVRIEAQHAGRGRDIRGGFEDIDQVFKAAKQHGAQSAFGEWAELLLDPQMRGRSRRRLGSITWLTRKLWLAGLAAAA